MSINICRLDLTNSTTKDSVFGGHCYTTHHTPPPNIMTVLQIVLSLTALLSLLATVTSMYALYQCSIVRLSGLRPDHPKVKPAEEFVTLHGGVDRVERGCKTGIEIFAPLALLASIVLALTFAYPPPLP